MSIVCIIQARLSSTRLPGKALIDIGGMSMLARVVRRVQRAQMVDRVVVATTVGAADEAIVSECARLGISVVRGSEEDVLDRYYQAAKAHQAALVARVTSDCPLIEPTVIDTIIGAFQAAQPDYASNVINRSYPRGLDLEVFTFHALEQTWYEGREPYQRAHVTPFMYQHPERFNILSVSGDTDYSAHRWTVDTPEDLAFVRAVYKRFGNTDTFTWRQVLDLVEQEPELAAINAHIEQKELRQG